MKILNYKYIYADTNLVSDICKPNGLMNKFLKQFSVSDYLFCFSTYTLYEISKSDELMIKFQKFYSVFPCVVVASYFPLAIKEFEFIEDKNKTVNPILFSPQGIRVLGKSLSPESLKLLIENKEVQMAFKNVEEYTSNFYLEMQNIFDSEEFEGVDSISCSRNQFIDRFKKFEFRYRFLGGEKLYSKFDKRKINKMKSLEVLAQGIYYKFYSDKMRKVTKSDIIDVLIMTSAPYADIFISEGNCVDIYKKILKMNKSGISGNVMTISELRNK